MTSVAIEPRGTDRLDRVGAVASSLCAVHCAVCALLPAAFGALGMGSLLGHEAEWVFTLIAVAFAAGALISGWRRHRSVWVAGLLALGIAGLLASRGSRRARLIPSITAKRTTRRRTTKLRPETPSSTPPSRLRRPQTSAAASIQPMRTPRISPGQPWASSRDSP